MFSKLKELFMADNDLASQRTLVFNSNKLMYTAARSECVGNNGDLATTESQTTKAQILSAVSTNASRSGLNSLFTPFQRSRVYKTVYAIADRERTYVSVRNRTHLYVRHEMASGINS